MNVDDLDRKYKGLKMDWMIFTDASVIIIINVLICFLDVYRHTHTFTLKQINNIHNITAYDIYCEHIYNIQAYTQSVRIETQLYGSSPWAKIHTIEHQATDSLPPPLQPFSSIPRLKSINHDNVKVKKS